MGVAFKLGLKLLFVSVALGLGIEHFIAGQPDGAGGIPNYDHATRPYLRDAGDLDRRPGEARMAYATRMNRAVHERTWHCPHYVTGMSLIERMISAYGVKGLFTHGLLVRERLNCGFCAQRSYMLKGILAEEGIASDLYFINEHVVLRSGTFVFDPDFGVGPIRLPARNVRQAYAGWEEEWPGFFEYVFVHPEPEADQIRWRQTIAARERVQRVYFAAANVIAVMLLAIGGLLLYSSTSRARKVSDAITSMDVSD